MSLVTKKMRTIILVAAAVFAAVVVVAANVASWEATVNVAIAMSSLCIMGGFVWLARLTHASGFYWKVAAFAFLTINRGLLVLDEPFFVDHSQQFALGFYVLFAIGVVLTLKALLQVYQPPQDPFRDTSNGSDT
jgi:hypothetical protein